MVGLLEGGGAAFTCGWAASGSWRPWCKVEAFRYQCRAVLAAASKAQSVQACSDVCEDQPAAEEL